MRLCPVFADPVTHIYNYVYTDMWLDFGRKKQL